MRAMCLVAVAAFTLTGCGGGGADGAFKETIAAMNNLSDAAGSGDTAKIQKAAERMKAAAAAMEGVKVSAEDKKKLEEKYGGEMIAAVFKLAAAQAKLTDEQKKMVDEAMKSVK